MVTLYRSKRVMCYVVLECLENRSIMIQSLESKEISPLIISTTPTLIAEWPFGSRIPTRGYNTDGKYPILTWNRQRAKGQPSMRVGSSCRGQEYLSIFPGPTPVSPFDFCLVNMWQGLNLSRIFGQHQPFRIRKYAVAFKNKRKILLWRLMGMGPGGRHCVCGTYLFFFSSMPSTRPRRGILPQ
jgi:hypothetical protein